MRLDLILLALAASAGAAHAADRYGPGQSDSEASRQAYGQAAPSSNLLNWSQKAPPPARHAADAYGRSRPEPLSDWARRAEVQRADRMSTPVQGQVIPQSSYLAGTIANPMPGALPTSLYGATPSPAAGYRVTPRPRGAAIDINPDALPNQPSIAQQMANEEAAAVQESKAARAKAMDNKNRSGGALVSPQDAVR